MAKPIFVVGKNRSGTKWVTNILSNHREIAVLVRHEKDISRGCIETNLLSRMALIFGSLEDDENYIGFVECFTQTDEFKLMGLDKRILYLHKPKDYLKCFKYLMDNFAEQKGAKFYAQKTDCLQMKMLLKHFPDARFIVVRRKIVDNIRSMQMLRRKEGKKKNIFREVYIYHLMDKSCKPSNQHPILYVDYENLVSDKEQVVRKICKHIGLEYNKELLVDRFKKNTSFENKSRNKELSGMEEFMIRLISAFMRMLPLAFYKVTYRLYLFFRGSPYSTRFVPGSFRYLRKQIGWNHKD